MPIKRSETVIELSMNIQWRKGLLAALRRFKLTEPLKTIEELQPVLTELSKLKERLPLSDRPVIEVMEYIVNGFLNLCNWLQASLAGELQAERFLRAAQAQTILALEILSSNIRFPMFANAAQETIHLIENVSNFKELKDIATQLQCIPVPVFQLTPKESWRSIECFDDGAKTNMLLGSKEPFVIKVMFEIDRKPWSTPQILLANKIYNLSASVTISQWPDDTDHLLLDYVATLDRDHYKISPLQIERSVEEAISEFNLDGHAAFPVPQNILSEPIVIRVLATFLSSSDPHKQVPATIVGYHQLRVRVSDAARTPLLSRYGSIDERNLEIIEEIDRSLPGLNPEHRSDFIEALGAVTNYMGVNLQQGIYHEKLSVNEAYFQEKLLYHMRTLLGQDVQEAPWQGGGETDIQYKSVTVELKVEKTIKNRRKMIEKYLAQPTQYSSAGGTQLGILCILDTTEKHDPPANPKNNITLESPSVHGFIDGNVPFPTKIAAVIIDGNLRLPHSYSR